MPSDNIDKTTIGQMVASPRQPGAMDPRGLSLRAGMAASSRRALRCPTGRRFEEQAWRRRSREASLRQFPSF